MTAKKKTPSKKKTVAKTDDVNTETTMPNPDDLPVPCVFHPKEDITTYELATLIHYLLRGSVTFGDWKKLEEKFGSITRHLQPVQNPSPVEVQPTGE